MYNKYIPLKLYHPFCVYQTLIYQPYILGIIILFGNSLSKQIDCMQYNSCCIIMYLLFSREICLIFLLRTMIIADMAPTVMARIDTNRTTVVEIAMFAFLPLLMSVVELEVLAWPSVVVVVVVDVVIGGGGDVVIIVNGRLPVIIEDWFSVVVDGLFVSAAVVGLSESVEDEKIKGFVWCRHACSSL